MDRLMAYPNRHFLFSAIPGLLIASSIAVWTHTTLGLIGGTVAGFWYAVFAHTPTDLLFQEHFEESRKEILFSGAFLGIQLALLFIFASCVFGWMLTAIMFFASILQDLADYVLVNRLFRPPFFPNHFYPSGNYQRWPNWFKEESFRLSMFLETAASVTAWIICYFSIGWLVAWRAYV